MARRPRLRRLNREAHQEAQDAAADTTKAEQAPAKKTAAKDK